MIIDTHVHTGLFEDIDRIVDMSEEKVLEAMDLYNIDMVVVSNAAVEFDCEWNPVPMEKQITQKDSFLSAIAFARANMDKLRIMPWVKPSNETPSGGFVELLKEYLDIVSNRAFGQNRQMIVLLLGKLKEESAVPTLIDLLEDEEVRLQAISALGEFKREEFRCYFERFQNSTHPGWRKYAREALKKINR